LTAALKEQYRVDWIYDVGINRMKGNYVMTRKVIIKWVFRK
jgi:hypothetical protein